MQKYRRLEVRLKLKITGCKCRYEDGKNFTSFRFLFYSHFLLVFSCILTFLILFLLFYFFSFFFSCFFQSQFDLIFLIPYFLQTDFFFAHFIITYQPTRSSAFVKPQLHPLICRCLCEIYLFLVLIIRHGMKEQGKSSYFE